MATPIYSGLLPLPGVSPFETEERIVRREDGTGGFAGKTQAEYDEGFGDPSKSYWLGLRYIRALTFSCGPVSAQVEIGLCDGRRLVQDFGDFFVLPISS